MDISNGFQICFGDRTFTSAKNVSAGNSYDVVHGYALAFANYAGCVLVGTYNVAFKGSVAERTKNNFKARLRNIASSATTIEGFVFVAFGY